MVGLDSQLFDRQKSRANRYQLLALQSEAPDEAKVVHQGQRGVDV